MGSLNCVGLRNMLTTVMSFSLTERLTSEAWPSCRAPMVGTSPIVFPALLASARVCCKSEMLWITCIFRVLL